MKLLRTIRLDDSDTFLFETAAESGEWAVSGAFAVALERDDHPEAISQVLDAHVVHGRGAAQPVAERLAATGGEVIHVGRIEMSNLNEGCGG